MFCLAKIYDNIIIALTMVIVNINLFLNNSALRLRSCNDEKSETVVGPTNQLCAKCKVIQRTHEELKRLSKHKIMLSFYLPAGYFVLFVLY